MDQTAEVERRPSEAHFYPDTKGGGQIGTKCLGREGSAVVSGRPAFTDIR